MENILKNVKQAIMKINNFNNIVPNFISFLFISLIDIDKLIYDYEYTLITGDIFELECVDNDLIEIAHQAISSKEQLSKQELLERTWIVSEMIYVSDELKIEDDWYDNPYITDDFKRLLIISSILNHTMYILNANTKRFISNDISQKKYIHDKLNIARKQVDALEFIGQSTSELSLEVGNLGRMVSNLAGATNNIARETNKGIYKPSH